MPQATVKTPVILRIKDLAQRYGCDVRTIFRYHAEGTIPKARYLPRKYWPFWYQHEIVANEQRRPRLKHKMQSVVTPAKPAATQFTFKL